MTDPQNKIPLEKLTTELCPNGVEYKPLGEILTIKNGSDYKSFPAGKIPVYGSGGIIAYTSKIAFDKPTVLIPRKGSVDKLYYVTEPFWNVDTIFYTDINTEVAIPRYIYYCLQKEHLEKLNTAGGVPSLTQTVLNKVTIPLPPTEIQHEIVRILDKFTDLSALLETELIARKKQYEYYREKLLTFGDDVDRRLLGEMCHITTGKLNVNEKDENGQYPFFTCDEKPYRINKYAFDTTAILISGNGSQVGHINLYSGKFNAYQRTYVLSNFEQINIKFLYQYLKGHLKSYIVSNSRKASIPYITLPMLSNFEIPLPPLTEQKRIADILDRFDSLCNDLTSGIPAEIAARKKQYEYYRDRLLTFREKIS